jgi:single-stranded-DNA-specific exonuclease
MKAPSRDKLWRIPAQPNGAAESLARQVGVSSLAARVLCRRGVQTPEEARAFLQPSLHDLHDPALMPGVSEAADRIRRAVACEEPICIYGDYDVDGISATAILLRCLKLLGVEAFYHIPRRLEEGYGLNAEAIGALAEGGARLLITVDCGIRAVEQVALARELGLDVIVTDHHEPGEVLPAGAILINPKLAGSAYPFRDLAGAGVAFKLAWAVGKSFADGERVSPEFREFLFDSLTLAALGTIADVVPLRGENRVIARYGLVGLGQTRLAGIRALCDACGISEGVLSAFDVGFKLAPRLNAAGRMGCARRCVDLLTLDCPDRTAALAAELNRENTRRQKVQEQVLGQARDMLAQAGGADDACAIVLAREDWHAGVVGIAAARLANEFWRPAVLLTIEEGVVHGSARSIASLNLHDSLTECARHLESFGGHAMAAGLRLRAERYETFREAFERAVAKRLGAAKAAPSLELDAEVALPAIDRGLLDELESLAPFGQDNPRPVFAAFDVEVQSGVRRMGSGGKHLSFWAQQEGAAFRAVAFGLGDRADALAESAACSIAFVPKINRWRGRESIELEVVDLRLDSPDALREQAHGRARR